MQLIDLLSKQSRSRLIGLGMILAILLGAIHYIIGIIIGIEVSFSIFYLLPIALVTWFAGIWSGLLISVVSAILWFMVQVVLTPSFSHPVVPAWNATVRLGFFVIVTCALSALRAARARQEELIQFVVHDLSQPLTAALMSFQVLQRTASESMNEAQRDLIERSIMSCLHMLTLTNSLLDLSRLESGQIPLQVSRVNVKELVDSSLEQVSLWAEQHGVTLTNQLDPGVETVRADRLLTVRVLVNLLSNAIKASRPESVVTVRVAPFDPRSLAFYVSDEGTGIPPEWVNKVFDKFALIEARKAGIAVGSGLGLSFCQRAVEAQGGRIQLVSEVGQGTTVTFTLPTVAQ